MAEIQMVYRDYICDAVYGGGYKEHCMQCHTEAAGDLGCRGYKHEDVPENVIPCSACVHAIEMRCYKGVSTKRYEMHEFEDSYNPWLNCMHVIIGKGEYDCEKVVLDGQVIYDKTAQENKITAAQTSPSFSEPFASAGCSPDRSGSGGSPSAWGP